MLNTVSLIGRLGADPEMRYTSTGVPVASFRIAVNEHRRDPAGEKQERTHWFSCVAWKNVAETVVKYLAKGSQVGISGVPAAADDQIPFQECRFRIAEFGIKKETTCNPQQTTHSDTMQPSPLKQYFRVDEVAEYFAISVRTVYRLIDEGELSRTKIRGCLRVPLTEIRRYERELERQMGEG